MRRPVERKKPAPDAVGVHPVPVSAGRYRITSARYWIYCAVVCRINRRYASRSRSMRVRICSGNRSNCLRIYWRLVIGSYLRVLDAIERNTHPPGTVPGGWVGGWWWMLAKCFDFVCWTVHRDRDIFGTGRGARAKFAISALDTGCIVRANYFTGCGSFTRFKNTKGPIP